MEISGKYQSILFDLDGVLTPTAELHMQAWEQLFREYFTHKSATFPNIEPYSSIDYFQYLDGKPRYEGVQSLLLSRLIDLPWGEENDSPEIESVCGLGNRKNQVFLELLEQDSLLPYPGSAIFLQQCLDAQLKVAVVSSSKNARQVLQSAGLLDKFGVIVDGLAVAQGHLRGKPQPDMFLAAADALGAAPHRSVVIEDAIVGVMAGAAGDFGLVIGVNRGNSDQAELLLRAGADVVVEDLSELVKGKIA